MLRGLVYKRNMLTIQTVIYASFLFFLSEFVLLVVKRSGKGRTKTKGDRKSLVLLWITIVFGITAGFFLANWQDWSALNAVIALLGLLLFVAGMVVRWVSIIQLNKEFTVDVAILDHHHLKTEGMYKYLRHPSYLGLVLVCLGLAIAMNSMVSLVVVTIPVVLALNYRMKTEEDVLMRQFGAAYQEYRKKTDKIIPKIY